MLKALCCELSSVIISIYEAFVQEIEGFSVEFKSSVLSVEIVALVVNIIVIKVWSGVQISIKERTISIVVVGTAVEGGALAMPEV